MSEDDVSGPDHAGVPDDTLPARLPMLALDPAPYRADLAEFKLSEAQETELLQTLWSIMHAFVEIGYKIDVGEKLSSKFNDSSKGNPSRGIVYRPQTIDVIFTRKTEDYSP